MVKTYFIQTFGCAQNVADSEKIAVAFEGCGYTSVDSWKKADVVIINTCMVRQMAEDRVYGLVRNIVGRRDIGEVKGDKKRPKIIVAGCMVGLASADKTGKILARMRERMPEVEFMKTEEILTNTIKYYPILTNTNKKNSEKVKAKSEERGIRKNPLEIRENPSQKIAEREKLDSGLRRNDKIGLVVISNGCNNFCTYCVVPFARGREVSRSWEEIIEECRKLKERGVKSIMLLGQNVNSWGADIVKNYRTIELRTVADKKNIPYSSTVPQFYRSLKPVLVKHLGRYRIPTLFPHLLDALAKLGFENVNFMSSNPWDFSDELIDVISKNKNITRTIHLPVQSGDDSVLKKMNRWYTAKQYSSLVDKICARIPGVKFTTDIIVGFPGETDAQFKHTVLLCRKVGFDKAYISLYSPRPMTVATKSFLDDVPHAVKKKRWEVLDEMINRR